MTIFTHKNQEIDALKEDLKFARLTPLCQCKTASEFERHIKFAEHGWTEEVQKQRLETIRERIKAVFVETADDELFDWLQSI